MCLSRRLAARRLEARYDSPRSVDRASQSTPCPFKSPAFARALRARCSYPSFASLMPQMIVPYADAAALMLANLDRGNAMSRHRVGLALPVGMRGRKSHWSAKAIHTM